MLKKQITIVVAVIKNDRGEILLAKRNQPEHPQAHGKWEFVGGGIEFGEDPEASLVREVKEEAGLDVKIIKLFPKIITDSQEGPNGEQFQIIAITYECEIVGGELKSSDPEIAELKFVNLGDLKTYDTFNNITETVKLLL